MTLASVLPGFCRLVALDSVGSTNEEARNRAVGGCEAWTLVMAREQIAGRGRRGNGWVSPPGNMYLSVVLRPGCDAATAAQLGFVTALALADAVAAMTGLEAKLKWPNDLLIEGGKLSGILIESVGGPGGPVEWVVIGTGLNLVSHPDSVPGATDLAAHGRRVAVDDMVAAYVAALVRREAQWRSEGFVPVRRDWIARATGLHAPVRVRVGGREEHGIFEDLDDTGALVLLKGSQRRLISSGDVFPAGAA
jgi:BirA family biotin operon repressor/biotin-[acetyl-CoA-carboxylase] ligase